MAGLRAAPEPLRTHAPKSVLSPERSEPIPYDVHVLRNLLAHAPWLLLLGAASAWTGMARCPTTMTVGYELLFEDLWLPVALGGVVVLVLGVALTVAAFRADAWRRPAVHAPSRLEVGPLVALVLAAVAWGGSMLAHGEAVRRSDEAYAIDMAHLHDDPVPAPTAFRFHTDWRTTAHLARALYLVAVACFVTWIVWRAARAARRLAMAPVGGPWARRPRPGGSGSSLP